VAAVVSGPEGHLLRGGGSRTGETAPLSELEKAAMRGELPAMFEPWCPARRVDSGGGWVNPGSLRGDFNVGPSLYPVQNRHARRAHASRNRRSSR
jgi:hypothetical protein